MGRASARRGRLSLTGQGPPSSGRFSGRRLSHGPGRQARCIRGPPIGRLSKVTGLVGILAICRNYAGEDLASIGRTRVRCRRRKGRLTSCCRGLSFVALCVASPIFGLTGTGTSASASCCEARSAGVAGFGRRRYLGVCRNYYSSGAARPGGCSFCGTTYYGLTTDSRRPCLCGRRGCFSSNVRRSPGSGAVFLRARLQTTPSRAKGSLKVGLCACPLAKAVLATCRVCGRRGLAAVSSLALEGSVLVWLNLSATGEIACGSAGPADFSRRRGRKPVCNGLAGAGGSSNFRTGSCIYFCLATKAKG